MKEHRPRANKQMHSSYLGQTSPAESLELKQLLRGVNKENSRYLGDEKWLAEKPKGNEIL